MSPDTRFEPELALFGGEDTGFELYEQFFKALVLFRTKVESIICIIEFGYDQREISEEILSKYGWKYVFFADYA